MVFQFNSNTTLYFAADTLEILKIQALFLFNVPYV